MTAAAATDQDPGICRRITAAAKRKTGAWTGKGIVTGQGIETGHIMSPGTGATIHRAVVSLSDSESCQSDPLLPICDHPQLRCLSHLPICADERGRGTSSLMTGQAAGGIMIAGGGPIMKIDGCLSLRQQAGAEPLSMTVNCKCSY